MQFAPQKPQRRVSKKMQQFLDEVNNLCDHYQYQLQPTLNYTPQGVVPVLSVNDVPPKRKKVPAKEEIKKGKVKKPEK